MNVEDIKKITVVGAGVMGSGIVQVCARSGFKVMMVDVNEDLLNNAYKQIKDGPFGLSRLVEKGKIKSDEVEQIMGYIESTTDPKEAANDADLVIEAVSENLELKKKIWSQYDELCPEKTIFASNTSTIMITDQAAATKRADRFIGMHWFNPAPVMKLIEVIRGALTSDSTFDFIVEFSKKLGKIPVEASDSPGFFTSRFISEFMIRGVRMFEEGVAGIKEIDTMCKLGFGFPMGPFELMDLTGIDIIMHAGEYVYNITGDPNDKTPITLRKLVTAGYIGKKPGSKGGWYDFYNIK